MNKRVLAFLVMAVLPSALLADPQDGPPKGNPNMLPGKTSFYLKEDKGIDIRPAEEVKAELPEHIRDFVNKYEQVKRTQDEELLAELIHPASKACEDDSNTDYFHNLRVFYLTEELNEHYRLKLIPVLEEKRWHLKLRTDMPLPPTHVMYMEYSTPEGEIEGLQRYLREEEYPELRIYELVKCPDDETLRKFREPMQSE